MIRRLAATLAAALLALAGHALAQSHGPAFAPANVQPKALASAELRLPAASARAARIALPAPPAEQVAAVKKSNSQARLKRLEIGFGRDIDATAPQRAADLAWAPVRGGLAARWEVSSQEAAALRVALDPLALPRGTEVRFAGRAAPEVFGPFGVAELTSMGTLYWSPVIQGDTAIVEVFVPTGADPGSVALSIPRISHLFASPMDPFVEMRAKASGACEVDFICRASSDAALAQTGRAVARMAFTTSSGGTGLCTGTLLNPADGSFTPYFFSAAHCFGTQSVASTLVTFWFYEHTSCGGTTINPGAVQLTGGATLLFANTVGDVAFMRLNASPPSGAVYAGWDASLIPVSTPVTAIHHPQGDPKKVSLGRVTGYTSQSIQAGNYVRVFWNSIATGVTEGGSSGSGIFSGDASAGYLWRGGLLGGASSCSAGPSELYDDYSRFDLVYPSLRRWLNPAAEPARGPNVVANPGFESGRVTWVESSSMNLRIITEDAAAARAGSWYAWMGGEANVSDTLYQDIVVPASSPQLQFFYRITTAERVSGEFDKLTVALVDPSSGATLATVATFSNETATGGWTQSLVYDLSAFAGRTVRLRFSATNDFSDPTSFRIDDVSLTGAAASSGAANYTALWWNASESGWGINVNHQGDIAFATLFTYDGAGVPMWLVMSNGARQGSTETFSGPLFRTTGPPFNAMPFTPINAGNLTQVGTMTLAFGGPDAGTLTYSVNGVNVTKSITKQVFGASAASCTGTTASRAGATNYQDLWWNPAESGWGVNLTHQGNTIFATLFTYRSDGQGLWLVMSNGVRQPDGSYVGELYQTSGPPFNASPWTAIGVTQVGLMSLRFSDGTNGTLQYSVNNVTVTKAITRQVFSSPVPLCAG